jgi:lipoprotein-anchoring transpeptidase ErfK/SrfK
MFMLVLIVVIVGLVILIKSRSTTEPAAVESTPPRVAINDVLPPSRTVAEPAPAPRQTPLPSSDATPLTPRQTTPPSSEPMPLTPTTTAAAPIAQPPAAAAQPAPVAAPQEVQTLPTATGVPATAAAPVSPAAVEDTMNQTSLEAQQLIEKALALRDAGNVVAARDLLNDALNMKLSPQVRAGVKLQMSKLSEKWLFGRDVLSGDKLTAQYLVQPGDLLTKIGRQHKVPFEILLKINGLARPESLQAGRRIKVVHGPFNAVINRTTFTMDVYLQNVYVKSYKVGLGKTEHTTPTGRWTVATGGKMISPTWTDPDTGKTYVGSDPDYPLGSRWIALDGIEGDAKGRTGFALHGTKEPDTIGTLSSRGCIRLFNGDVIEVYDLMEPGQSGVIVMD